MKDIKLTSVKVLESLYKRFKINTVNSNMTLQKITNRAISLYLNDNEFKDTLDNTDELFISGSNF
jgi:hypothetical protein